MIKAPCLICLREAVFCSIATSASLANSLSVRKSRLQFVFQVVEVQVWEDILTLHLNGGYFKDQLRKQL